LHAWSRVWEYTYLISAIENNLPSNREIRIIDLGSGVTFAPYYIGSEILRDFSKVEIEALDSDLRHRDRVNLET
jgi:hypothetical protein